MITKEIVQIKTCELYDLLSVKCVDILSAHKLLKQIHKVIWYRHQLKISETPEAESLARWSLRDARDKLDYALFHFQFCDLDKALVRWIANNSEYEEK